jgi:hypothetical protein
VAQVDEGNRTVPDGSPIENCLPEREGSPPPTVEGSSTQVSVPDEEFFIYLEFPGQNRPRMRFRVFTRMSVRLFYNIVARNIVGCVDYHIRIFVDNECLLHVGTVTDRHFPDMPNVPTVYLTPDCTAVVIYRFAATSGRQPTNTRIPWVVATGDPVPGEDDPVPGEDNIDERTEGMLQNLVTATDKYEAAIAMQPEAAVQRVVPNPGELDSVRLPSTITIEEATESQPSVPPRRVSTRVPASRKVAFPNDDFTSRVKSFSPSCRRKMVL